MTQECWAFCNLSFLSIHTCVYRIIMTAASSLSVSSTSCSQSRCATWKRTQVRLHWGWGVGGLVHMFTNSCTVIHTHVQIHSRMYTHFSTMHVTSTHFRVHAYTLNIATRSLQFLNLTLLSYYPTSDHYGP